MSAVATEPLVEIEHLSKVFPIKTRSGLGHVTNLLSAVDDVSLTIARGETLGLVGESGSGKTTLARLALRLLPLTSGSIKIGGTDIHSADRRTLRDLRRFVQIVFQDPTRRSTRACRSERSWPKVSRAWAAPSASEKSASCCSHVGLPSGFARRHPHQLSGGQRQRVGIARALAVEPQFLVLDEPVSALDVSVQSQVLNLLRDLQQEFGLTYLFISHDLTVVRHLADRIAVMYLGKLVELAPADDIFERPRHPYTRALLSAMPSITDERRERIILSGDIPSPIDPPPQCRFASRCFRPVDECWTTVPPLERLEPEHDVACFNPVPAPTEPGGSDGQA